MYWTRFYVNIKKVKGDYRPVIWPIKYPYWCSGESDKDFILVAYVDSLDDLYKQWPEATKVESEKVDKIEYSSRFPKPDWYEEEPEVDDNSSKRLVIKFEVVVETDTDNVIGDNNEDKLEQWKRNVDIALFDALDHWGEVSFTINCKQASIEKYD